jgi:hypothetical protein
MWIVWSHIDSLCDVGSLLKENRIFTPDLAHINGDILAPLGGRMSVKGFGGKQLQPTESNLLHWMGLTAFWAEKMQFIMGI